VKNYSIFTVMCILVSMVMIATCGAIATPDQKASNMIETEKLPGQIQLSGANDASMERIAESLVKIKKTPRWLMQDLGYLTSEPQSLEQENEPEKTSAITRVLEELRYIDNNAPKTLNNTTNNTNTTNTTWTTWMIDTDDLIYL
jgi:hypothetical protein